MLALSELVGHGYLPELLLQPHCTRNEKLQFRKNARIARHGVAYAPEFQNAKVMHALGLVPDALLIQPIMPSSDWSAWQTIRTCKYGHQ